jgi:hypothetical protein
MHEPGGLIEFVVGMDEPEPQEQGARGSVLGMVVGKEGLETENGKGVVRT